MVDLTHIRTGYELLFFTFHLSLFVCVVAHFKRRKYPFTTAFYLLYLLQGVAIYLTFGVQLWNRFIPGNDVFAGTVGVFRFVLFHLGIFFYLLSQTAVSVNRLTALLLPLKHEKLWSGISLLAIVATLYLISFVCASLRPALAAIWSSPNGFWKAFEEADPIQGLVMSLVCTATFILNVSLQAWSFVLFYRLSTNNRKKNNENLRLLVYTTLSEVLELVRVICLFSSALHWDNIVVTVGWQYLTYVGFVQWFSSAICLLTTRQALVADNSQ
ncbi:hypothetical protein AAVH_30730, partial [Aphelenchoides avenae]